MRRMNIAIDLLPITGMNAGLQTYAQQLVMSLAMVDKDSEYLLLVNPRAKHLFTVPESNFKIIEIPTPKRFIGYWEQIYLPVMRVLRHVDLLHSPVSALPLWAPCKTVVTVLDLTFRFFPKTMKWWSRWYWGYFLSRAAKKADKVIVPSKSTGSALLKSLSLSEEQVSVVELCCSESFFQHVSAERIESTKRNNRITGKYILTVGTLEPRKNITTLIEAFAIVSKAIEIKLVIAGARGWLFHPIFKKVEALGITRDVIFTGHVPEEDLPALYQGAELFVFPSLYEGFGLPPLEAMASGIPVVASNSSSIPEVVGDSGILVDAHDVKAFAVAITKLCNDANYRAILGKMGKQRARQFTVEKMGKKTVKIYQEVFERK